MGTSRSSSKAPPPMRRISRTCGSSCCHRHIRHRVSLISRGAQMKIQWIAIAAFVAAVPVSILGQKDWPTYGHDVGGMRYSPLTQITPANVATLRRVWTYETGEDSPAGYQVTPLVVGTTMYLSTPAQKIVALDAE